MLLGHGATLLPRLYVSFRGERRVVRVRIFLSRFPLYLFLFGSSRSSLTARRPHETAENQHAKSKIGFEDESVCVAASNGEINELRKRGKT